MFESVELGQKLSKAEFRERELELRAELLDLQWRAIDQKVPVVVIVSGVEGAGKGEVVHRLSEWMDPRYISTHAFWEETDEERERPRFWRFWRVLPAGGTTAVLFGSWYTRPIVEHAMGTLDMPMLEHEMKHITDFERMLVRGGALLVKLWFHLKKSDQKKRLENPGKFQASPNLEEFSKRYDTFIATSEQAIRLTDTSEAPWLLIESTNRRYRDIAAGEALANLLRQRLDQDGNTANHAGFTTGMPTNMLGSVDLTQRLEEEEYRAQQRAETERLAELAWRAHMERVNVVAVFEGWDAAGKGGAIRRITKAMDPRLYRVIPVAAPTDEELAHHYLWRFWRHIPPAGQVTIYDRSWYGRVLVERVEGYASEIEWSRAYHEINAFEGELIDHGTVLLKFWLHLSPDEQLRRFREREVTPHKQHKITEDDWRNRDKWPDYEIAVNEMVARTSTASAPWSLIAAEDKRFARVSVMRQFCDALAARLG